MVGSVSLGQPLDLHTVARGAARRDVRTAAAGRLTVETIFASLNDAVLERRQPPIMQGRWQQRHCGRG